MEIPSIRGNEEGGGGDHNPSQEISYVCALFNSLIRHYRHTAPAAVRTFTRRVMRIYIYIERERERERECVCVCVVWTIGLRNVQGIGKMVKQHGTSREMRYAYRGVTR